MSKRDAKRDDEDDEEEEEEEDDISSSGGDDDESGSDEEMSESGSEHGEDKATAGGGKGKAGGSGQPGKMGSERSLQNQPFDEAVDLSESEDMSEAGKDSPKKIVKPLKNMPFDEALELSASAQDLESPVKRPPPQSGKSAGDGDSAETKATGASAAAAAAAALAAAELKNQPFDEEMDLSDSGESVDTNGPSSPHKKSMKNQKPAATQPAAAAAPAKAKETPAVVTSAPKAVEERHKPEEKKAPTPAQNNKSAPAPTKQPEKKAPEPKRKVESESSSGGSESEEEDDDEDEEEEEEEEEEEPVNSKQQKARGPTGGGGGGASAAGSANTGGSAMNSAAHAAMIASAGAYKESDYAHLKVSNEVKELFQYIGRFKPQEIELETRLKCFIPEYIPAVGDMDAFLKIPRPDNEPDFLGLKMLDEPSLHQSDATVLDLQLRSTSKKKHGDIVVRSIENAEKSPKEIDRWIKSIADLHRTKPPPQVHYTKPMPDIESLMQVWPDEFEELLGKAKLPGASLDISLEQYIRVICAILDIPVYKNVYESMHVLFTLYLEFRSNQHFMNYDEQLDVSSAQAQHAPPPFTSRREEVGFQDDYPGSSRK